MRILVVGAGWFGCEHLARLATMGGVTAAVADLRAEAAEAAAGRFGLDTHGSDAVSMMAGWRPDGVIVASAPAANPALAGAALAAGIPVLVEKPVAPTAGDVRALRAAEAASGTFALPGQILRFSAPHRRLALAVQGGRIGRVVSIASRRYRDAGHAARYAIDPVLMTMIHDIDLALWLGGGVAVRATALRAPEDGARSVTHATVADSTGAVWRLSTAWIHPTEDVPPDRVEVIGTEGSLELEVGRPIRAFGVALPGEAEAAAADAGDDPLEREVVCFLDAIRSGTRPAEVTLADSLHGIEAAEMILAALK